MTRSPTISLVDNKRGHYRFLIGIAPYSSAVVAMHGYQFVRAVLASPVPYETGFEIIDRTLQKSGQSRQALCAVELRLPRPLSFTGFGEFNAGYQELLASWDLLIDGKNPIARTNIAPVINPPSVPSLYAFAYTVPRPATAAHTNSGQHHSGEHHRESENQPVPDFVIAGAGDLKDQTHLSADVIVRPGDTSADAMIEKATCVMDVMLDRLSGIGQSIDDVTSVHIYTAILTGSSGTPIPPSSWKATAVNPPPLIEHAILPRLGGTFQHGIHWFLSHPPIEGLAFEMDMRRIHRQDLVIPE